MLKFQSVYVHPCIVDQQPHIVYPRGFAASRPKIFEQLKNYFTGKGYRLKEDQRIGKAAIYFKGNRRKIAPVLLFTASLLFKNSAFAEIELQLNQPVVFENHQVALQLVPNHSLADQIWEMSGGEKDKVEMSANNAKIANEIFNQLKRRYRRQPYDPDYILSDLRQIANYYSEFPEVVALLAALKDKRWSLAYKPDQWLTTAVGRGINVEKAVIHINTRAAAQLKLNNGCRENPVCIASPADAMLHELLHTFSMLVKTDEFISQGGLNSAMYPYQHEYSVIASERKLYARMSLLDTVKRPARFEHVGRMVKADCPTCIK